MSMSVTPEFQEAVNAALGADLLASTVEHGQLIVTVPAERIVPVMTMLRDDRQFLFEQMIDVCGVDYPDRPQRFEVVYSLLSVSLNRRLRVKVATDEDTPVPSVVSVYPSANWFERETWDLYGVFFADHPDLRRIVTDYGFEGHPLRKDYKWPKEYHGVPCGPFAGEDVNIPPEWEAEGFTTRKE